MRGYLAFPASFLAQSLFRLPLCRRLHADERQLGLNCNRPSGAGKPYTYLRIEHLLCCALALALLAHGHHALADSIIRSCELHLPNL